MAVRTTDYQDVIRGIANKGGVLSARLQTEESALLFEFINSRYRQFHENTYWTELTVVEERYFRQGLWAAGTYIPGDIVYYSTDAVYYEQTSVSNTTETPSSTATDWTVAGDFDKYVAYEQVGQSLFGLQVQTKMGDILAIYDVDPRLNPTRGRIDHVITNNGVGPVSSTPTSIFIQFRQLARNMSGMVEWDETVAYKVGDWVYYETTATRGNAYEVIVATTAAQSPVTTEASFTVFDFPYVSAEYVKHGALADWLASGGGGSELGDTMASVQLASYNNKRAEDALEREAFREFSQQTIYTSFEVRSAQDNIMGKQIRNDASSWQAKGLATSMTIDGTNNEVATELGATALADLNAEYFQIQVVGCTEGAYFSLDGVDPTSGTTRFLVDDKFSEVWSRATLNTSRWAQHTTAGNLVIQGVEF